MSNAKSAADSSRTLVKHEVDYKSGIHRITLDRPEVRNAISRALLAQLDSALDDVLNACAAPNPSVAALSTWQDAQKQAKARHQIALGWPTPPVSRRGSEHVDADWKVMSTSTSSAASTSSSSLPPSPPTAFTSMDSLPTSDAPSKPARCLIIQSSSTKAFCAGADLAERRTMSDEQVVEFLLAFRNVLNKLSTLPIATIAAIDGPALGGGLELALACDFRMAASAPRDDSPKDGQARTPLRPLLGFPECQLGIIPGAGGTQRVARLIGLAKAKSMIFTGRILNLEEAHRWGLVECCVEDESVSAIEQAERLANGMVASAPLSLAAAKAAIDVGIEMEIESGLDWEAACYRALLQTQDRREALGAFAEKRKPVFIGQ